MERRPGATPVTFQGQAVATAEPPESEVTYDLLIDSTEVLLSRVASPSADALRLVSIAVAADIVP